MEKTIKGVIMAKSTKTVSKGDDKPWEGRFCRECAHCVPYMRFETLTVKDQQPTMGACPHSEFKVLLSDRACINYVNKSIKIVINHFTFCILPALC